MLNSSGTCVNLLRKFSSSPISTNNILIGPAVRLIIQHYKINPNDIKATGPKKNLLKSDLMTFINSKKLIPNVADFGKKASSKTSLGSSKLPPTTSNQSYMDIPLTNMRQTIAKRLSASKGTIPHSYLSASIPINNILKLRENFAKNGVKISLNDFIIKAVALSLRSIPELNVQLIKDKYQHIPTIDVSIAVATPNGLITPIIFNADQLGIENISKKIRELAERAKQNKLKPNEFQGGTFTISNLGMFGIDNFTAIINPPQIAILTIGGTKIHLDENFKIVNAFCVTLCYDVRAINENVAQKFLGYLKVLLMEPDTMLINKTTINENMGNEKIYYNLDELN